MNRWRVAAALSLVAAAAAGALRQIGDPDLFWHLAAGRAMMATRSLIGRDDFSYTFRGHPVGYEALSDLLLHGAHRAGGVWGLHLLAAVAIIALGLLVAARGWTPTAPRIGWALAAVSLVAAGPWFIVRPSLFSFPLWAALLLIVDRHRASQDRCWLVVLVAVQWLWTNVHQSALLGAATALAYAGYAAACRLVRAGAWLPADEGRDLGATIVGGLATVAVTGLSPLGVQLFLVPFELAGYGDMINEWGPSSLRLILEYDPAFALLALLVLAAVPWGAGRKSLFDVGVLVGTFALALGAMRLAPMFAIAAAPFVARRLGPPLPRRRTTAWLVAVCLLGAPLGLLLWPEARRGVGFHAPDLPEGAARWIETRRPVGNPWNELSFGGYLIWRLYPQARVFIDGRTARLYPLDFVRTAWLAESDPRIFAHLAEHHRFEWALVGAWPSQQFGVPIAGDPRWALVYLDDLAAIYVRADGPNRSLAADGYRTLRHLTSWQDLLRRPPARAALERDVALALAQAPGSTRAHLWSAAAALLRGDLEAAERARRALAGLEVDPGELVRLDAAIARLAVAHSATDGYSPP